jgi:hypothetical protein
MKLFMTDNPVTFYVIANSSHVCRKPPAIYFRFLLCQMFEKKCLKSWDRDRMIQAVAAVRKNQMGFKKSQKMLNVPKT